MRRGRALLLTVAVLVALAIGVDFGAAAAAEYQVAKRMRAELGLATDPSVRIEGFPFLTQAASGTYEQVEVSAVGLPVGPLRDVGVEATLRDVEAPLGDVLGGGLASVPVGRVDGRVVVRDLDLGRAIGLEDLRIEPASDEELAAALDGAPPPEADPTSAGVRLLATTDLSGSRTSVRAIGLVELEGTTVRLTASDVVVDDGTELPPVVERALLGALSTEVDPGELPFAVTPTGVDVETGSLVVAGTATGVTIDDAGLGFG